MAAVEPSSELLEMAATWIAQADRVCCMTGAGISAESGIATFRGPDGLWEGRRPEDVATPEAFERDPESVSRFYQARRRALASARPNAGHVALAQLAEIVPEFQLITQNIDGLHREAGSRHVIELHGDLRLDVCTGCRWGRRVKISTEPSELPRCPECDSLLRPGVVWFGEILPPEAIQAAQHAADNCQVMLVVGTSSLVQPAASLASWAQTQGAKVVEINTETTVLSAAADVHLRGPSGELLPALVDGVRGLSAR